ncbi:hypothetical protein [Marinobacter sp. X15-166B]|uniref:hypothetical protein n=1 Tax=Marinobacter sp. X15-166B TaxID=1897620 RepID=UPI00085CA434|nr:hypothetical protein [Marinobacter sp. X15-166B]OEY66834.1 hypothetical protein BG841_10450 [Marinobacter sp. X15-166B]
MRRKLKVGDIDLELLHRLDDVRQQARATVARYSAARTAKRLGVSEQIIVRARAREATSLTAQQQAIVEAEYEIVQAAAETAGNHTAAKIAQMVGCSVSRVNHESRKRRKAVELDELPASPVTRFLTQPAPPSACFESRYY